MKLRSLALTNYRRHADTRIELPDGVTALLGRNGSGKSTLLEALGFALFGVGATRTGKDLLRWDDAAPGDPVRVVAELELGGEALHVVRELRGKALTPSASLRVDGTVLVPAGTGSNDAVTQAIQKRLGMDRDAFYATVVARQKELARLGDLGPTERKRLILGMLGVDALDRAIHTARAKRREAETRVDTLRTEIPDTKALKAQHAEAAKAHTDAEAAIVRCEATWKDAKQALREATRARDDAEAQHESRRKAQTCRDQAARDRSAAARRVEDLQEQVAAAEAAAAKAASLGDTDQRLRDTRAALETARRAQEAAARLDALQRRLQRVQVPPAANGALKTLRDELEALDAESRRVGEDLAVLRSSRADLESRLRRIADLGEDTPCPTCQRPLQDHLPALRAGLQGDLDSRREALTTAQERHHDLTAQRKQKADALAKAEARQKERAEREAERRHLQAQVDELLPQVPDGGPPDPAPLQRAAQAAEADHQKRVQADALGNNLATHKARHQAAVQDEASAAKAVAEADESLARLPDTGPALEAAKKAHAGALETERTTERRLLEARHAAQTQDRTVQDLQRRMDEAEARRKRLQGLEEEARYWGALAGGRGHGLLESFKDHLVARIGPAVSQEASRLLAAFTAGRYTEVLLDPEYRLFVADGGVPYTLDRFSGGESDLVHLALRLAVSRLLLERSGGAELRFLALDEVFGSLDEERRHSVLGALQELGGLYSQVLLVTHQEALRDALDAVLRVEERDGCAVVSLHKG